ncbi:RNA polymerase factor sigma-54 [Bacillus salitolerans]|uniref:RNA polymerase factor sigma-54 n=1 Tax=Bacillus salitolerans TaxID=1437434 RepID=A0ABW4LW75_9BACI
MNNRLIQTQTTKISLSKELRQAITLLQYSSYELSQYINQVSLENPFIRIHDTVYQTSGNYKPSGSKKRELELPGKLGPTLHEYICTQIEYLSEPLDVKKRALLLVNHIDEDGYMREDLSTISHMTGESNERLLEALSIIQTLEPVGVGAQTLQQSLSIQLKHHYPEDVMGHKIIDEYFTYLAEKKWDRIRKELTISIEDIKATFSRIQQLNPRPGADFKEEDTVYIVPDLYLKKDNHQYYLQHNDRSYTPFSIDEEYVTFKNEVEDEEAKHFIKEKYHQAKWLLSSVEQRNSTIMRVMEAILVRQKDYFDNGSSFLRPLTLREIADDINVHESTVSRAVRGKYVQTPNGVFELKYFFHSKVKSSYDKDVSSVRVKELIVHMLRKEDKQKPYSDQQISTLLKENHDLVVSRRTVAKYREQLHIPASTLRKQY